MPKNLNLDKEYKNFYDKGFSDKAISIELNVCKATVRNWRNKTGLKPNFISTKERSIELKKKESLFMELYDKGLKDKEIGEKIGFTEKPINNLRRKFLLPSNVHNRTEITKEMEEVLIGTLLGDAHISCRSYSKHKKITASGKLVFAHCEAHKDYCFHKYEILKSLFNREPQKNIQTRLGKKHVSYYATSKSDLSLKKYHNMFYKDFKKIIPKNIGDFLTEKSLAILFMDDGYSKQNKEYNISLCGFDVESLENFQKALLDKWNIGVSIHKSRVVYIQAKSREIFLSIIEPYIIPCMKYKIK